MRILIAAIALGGLVAAAGVAAAETAFPFRLSVQRIDLAAAGGPAALRQAAAETGSFVYVDWWLKNAWASEVFAADGAPAESTEASAFDREADFCQALAERTPVGATLIFSGRPDPGDNHFLLTMNVRLSGDDPFAIVRCEYSESTWSLRLRGFFWATDVGTATAEQVELRSVRVEADRIPADFFAVP